ncbi:MAG: ATP-binding protein [Cyanobacteria bacterium P01_F01_bin.53]
MPEELFALSSQPSTNQPALSRFNDEGDMALLSIQSKTQELIALQAERTPSVANTQLLKEIGAFQNSFALMGASLRAYLMTQSDGFRFEYTGYLLKNTKQWETIQASVNDLTPNQKQAWIAIQKHRQRFLDLTPALFKTVEGDRYREDLFVFNTQAEPLAAEMLTLLEEIVTNQQHLLAYELATGGAGLITAQWQTLLGSFLALGIGLGMALLLRKKIADPIIRLTQATTQVMEGDFDVKAMVESEDEIGILAETFNQMTGYIKQSHQDLESYNTTLECQKQELESKNIQIGNALDALQNTQAQLVQAEKMSSLGQMVAGIAHEINNPANFIQGNLPCAQEYTVDLIELLKLYQHTYPQASPEIEQKRQAIDLEFLLEDMPRTFASMETGTQRIGDIVTSLRNFSRLDESDMKQATLREGLDSTLLILQSRLGLQSFRPAVEVVKCYGDIHPIECYPGQLNQVFFNLLVNAIDALDNASHQQDLALWHPQIVIKTEVESAQIVLSITDNGEGIELSSQSRIFDPFFTTKPIGQGTGMGLSICHKIIVDRHKGNLSCESLPGEGTTFYIKIPLQQRV